VLPSEGKKRSGLGGRLAIGRVKGKERLQGIKTYRGRWEDPLRVERRMHSPRPKQGEEARSPLKGGGENSFQRSNIRKGA